MNPLLEIDFRIPFDQIQAAHVEPAMAQLMEEAAEKQKSLAASTGPYTFANTLLALESLTEKLDYAMGVVRHLESVATYPELRAAYNAVQPSVSLFYSGIVLDSGLWHILKEYEKTAEAAALTGTRKRFLEKTIEAFRRNGADLDEAGKRKLSEIDVELAQLTTKFSEHVLDSTNEFELILTSEDQLAGLPPTAVDAARENAKAKGKEGWRFTLQAPSYIPLMTYLDKRDIREQVYRAFITRASHGDHDNRAILASILEFRKAKATLLGFPDFADFVLEDRMAHSGQAAAEFLQRLKARTDRRFLEENQELQNYRASIEGAGAAEIQPWDVGYYAEKLRAHLYDFDEEALRPYFPIEQVLTGLFGLVHRLYGIRVSEETGVPAWHPETRYYSINDEDGTLLGCFYADWFPRDTKRGGAWMDAFLTGYPVPDGFKPHLGLMCGNLTPPGEERPSLLTHREAETIFHEFGHLLHHCLSKVEVRSLAGTNVPWDFVELPSQIMENWCWERESLDLFARHYQTGETVPDELFQKMKRARTFRSANAQMRQLGLGSVDLALHREYSSAANGDVVNYSRAWMQGYSPVRLPEEYAMITGFTHLFSSPVGYGAGYYSYKWAEVLDADAFTRFSKEGIFNRSTGMAFRQHILAKGNSDDPAALYRYFMNRDPDPEALLKRSGLA